MTKRQALARLKALGSAQTRKTYGRHGVTGDLFGVKFGDMAKLVREIKQDHELALELWETGNHDARVLATMIADPARLNGKLLAAWIKDVDNHVLSYQIAGIAGKSEAGRKTMKKWMGASGEWPCATGWGVLAQIASEPGAVPINEARDYLAQIEERIHGSKNRVKYSMNTAMIALGAYVPKLEDEAVRIAERIGQVEVDHGLTNCETPLAAPYIRKAAAHHRAKQAKAAKKKVSKSRASTKQSAKKKAAKGKARV